MRSFQSTLASNVLLPATCLTLSVVSSTVCASLILAECLGSLLLFYHAGKKTQKHRRHNMGTALLMAFLLLTLYLELPFYQFPFLS